MGYLGVYFVALFAGIAAALPTCTNTATPTNSIQPSIASGWEYAVVATGVTNARSIEFDSQGHLLVVQPGIGLNSYTIDDQGGVCVGVSSSKSVIANANLTHSLAFSNPTTLYVSTTDQVLEYQYDPRTQSVSGTPRVIVRNMTTTVYITRTLVVPRLTPNTIIVNRGANGNIDPLARDITSGVSTVKSFPLTNVPAGGWNHGTQGKILGWGVRNEVGVTEHPFTGGIWGVENSINALVRDGKDVQQFNPGDELNYFGRPTSSSPPTGSNFGYPDCFAAYNVSDLPNNSNLDVGVQFEMNSANDAQCQSRTAPRITFPAHVAPLDIKFNKAATEGWVSYHGSFSSAYPRVGYSVVKLAWNPATGQPVAPSNSQTAEETIIENTDLTRCPQNCFRPVGLLFDQRGRIFFSSDNSGEIYVLRRTNGAPA